MQDHQPSPTTPTPLDVIPGKAPAVRSVADTIASHVGHTRPVPETPATPTTPLRVVDDADLLDEDPAHLRVVDHVEDVLDVVGPQRLAEVTPGVKVSVCELPPARQRTALARLLTWDGAQVVLPGDTGSTRGRVLVRFASRPQLTVAFAVTAVAVLRRTGPIDRPFTWVLDEAIFDLDVTR